MKQKKIAVGVLFVVAGIVIYTNTQKTESVQQQEDPVTHERPTIEDKQVVKQNPPIQVESKRTSKISKEQIDEFWDALPEQTEAKAEVSQDHHKTPASIINFATILGSLMEQGKKSLADADMLIHEFNECLLKEDAVQSARALCLSHAQKLAKIHPELKVKVNDMKESAPEGISLLLERREQLMKSQKILGN